MLKAGRPIGERKIINKFRSDLSRLNIGNTLTLGTGAWPSHPGRRSSKVCPSTAECFDLVRFMIASANVFPGGRRSPSPGIDLYHFRIKDVTVLTSFILGQSKWGSVLPCLAT